MQQVSFHIRRSLLFVSFHIRRSLLFVRFVLFVSFHTYRSLLLVSFHVYVFPMMREFGALHCPSETERYFYLVETPYSLVISTTVSSR